MWLSCLASFILRVFQAYPQWSVYLYFTPLYGLVIFLTTHYHWPSHSSTGGHLVCFHFLTIMNKVSRTEQSCARFHVDVCSHSSGNCRPYGNSNIGRNRQTVSRSSCAFSIRNLPGILGVPTSGLPPRGPRLLPPGAQAAGIPRPKPLRERLWETHLGPPAWPRPRSARSRRKTDAWRRPCGHCSFLPGLPRTDWGKGNYNPQNTAGLRRPEGPFRVPRSRPPKCPGSSPGRL